MKNKLLVKTLEPLCFVLITLFIMTFLQLSSCNSDEKEIEYDLTLDRENADSVSLDSLIILAEASTALKNDSLLTQFSHSLPVVKISIDEKYLWSADSGLFAGQSQLPR